MHEYRQLVEREMKARVEFTGRGGQQRLADAADLSKQVVSNILNDTRPRLTQVPDDKTVEGLAKAFRLEPEVVWTAVAVALGLPSYVVPPITHEVRMAPNEVLVGELAKRLNLVAEVRPASTAEGEGKKTEREVGGVPVNDEAVSLTAEDEPKKPTKQRSRRGSAPGS